ncbi:XTP/dITP diphosphatase [Paenibacillus sp. y28]|uniref:XTP/dITP diphosphatase n=1 Tax=Paenibacillus sp. y28 TaxID=3129110 RepID=UPI00301A4BDC
MLEKPFPEQTLVVATGNKGKLREFTSLFAPFGITVRSLADYPQVGEIAEDGDTFAANAEIKARAVAAVTRLPVLADDSGLCVDALDGAPGVYSARYAGEPSDDAANNAKLLRELSQLAADTGAERQGPLLSTARFVCALALYFPGRDSLLLAEGACEGWITSQPGGEGGFGYDPLFYIPAYDKTLAQLTPEEKNAVSHRGQALRALLDRLQAA